MVFGTIHLIITQVWLLTRLTFDLLNRFLFTHGVGWFVRFMRLMLFVALLFPAMMYFLWQYIRATNIIRQVEYGPNARNYLDIYLPWPKATSTSPRKPAPVVIFYTGGAWIIGYKAWNLFVAPQLNAAGCLVVSPDYRNFPQGTASDMVEDGSAAVAWVREHISEYGGDPGNITLVGQSAGAWLVAMLILQRAATEPMQVGWSCSDVRSVVAISGPYDIGDPAQVVRFHERGLYKSVLYSIFEGELSRWSPARYARGVLQEEAGHLPPIVLMHGAEDKTVPAESSLNFASVLRECGASSVESFTFAGKSHTDGIIEDAIVGANPMMERLLAVVLHSNPDPARKPAKATAKSTIVPMQTSKQQRSGWYPSALIRLARTTNPF